MATSPTRSAPLPERLVIDLPPSSSAQTTGSRDRVRTFASIVLVGLDFALVNVAFYLAWFARYRMGLVLDLDPGNYVEHDRYVPLQLALAVVFVLLLALSGLYRLPRAASALDDLSTVFTASGLALMIMFATSTF